MKTIINCETGEITQRELNKKELEIQAKYNEQSLAEKAEAEAKAQAKAAAQAKLAALGLTISDLEALGL